MRFDDALGTVLADDLATPASAQAAWRQVVDLIGRGRAPADEGALAILARIRHAVPVAVRAASARALFGARPPAALVRLLALDDIAVGAPILRTADLAADAWIALLPALSPTARAVLRHRRDLPAEVVRALESYGAVDFVIANDAPIVPGAAPAAPASIVPPADPVAVMAPDSGPFVAVGAVAMGLPLVAEALRRENDNEAPRATDGTFRIADVVARLEAFQRKREQTPAPVPAPTAPPVAGFRFETDASGVIRWAEGVPRGAVIGINLARPACPTEAGVDGLAAGAFRGRARFADARLLLGGSGAASGLWLISAIPAFDAVGGRFLGYRGSGRRPRGYGNAEAHASSDSLRQLVHELRTPTNAIAGFSEMIEHQMLGPVSDPYRDQAVLMRTDSGRLLAAIDDLDAAARIDAGALQMRAEQVALVPLLDRVTAELQGLGGDRGTRIVVAAEGASVVADGRTLERLAARMIGAMAGAATSGENIAVTAFDANRGRIGLSVTRPATLDAYPGDAVLAIDDEDSPASLLGIGFALRLVRNLAREMGGSVSFGQRSITLYLPAASQGRVEQAQAR